MIITGQEDDSGPFTKYERARMIGSRALQISMGAPFLIKWGEKEYVKLLEQIYDLLQKDKPEFPSEYIWKYLKLAEI